MATKNANGHPITLGGIKSWLQTIIILGTLLIGLGAFKGTWDRYSRQVDLNTERLNLVEKQYIETQVQLARIQTDLGYLRADVGYLRAAVDKLVEMHTAK